MPFHTITCPGCGGSLEVEATENSGGVVAPTINVLGFEPAPEVKATPAAVAHAEEVGVPLTQVEGSGAEGTITKADVVAAASSEPTEEATASA